MLFFSLQFGGREGNHLRKSQVELPSLYTMRAGQCGMHHGLAGICTIPDVRLEAKSTLVHQAMRPEQVI